MKIYISGKLCDSVDAKVSVFDHGLLYGDGVFEGIRVYGGCVFKLEEHLERLEYSAKAILLEMPWSREFIAQAVVETCNANHLVDGYVRLVVTRGVGSLGLSPKDCKNPELIIIADKIQIFNEEVYKKGVKLMTAGTRRVAQGAFSSAVKSLNYLNNIMAKVEAMQAGYADALMLNEEGKVAEGSASNIFIVQKGELRTPRIVDGALRGVTRDVVIEIGRGMGMEVKEEEMTRYDIWNAEECFLTGTAAEVVPVVGLDGRVIGSGRPGEKTEEITRLFRMRVNKEGRMLKG